MSVGHAFGAYAPQLLEHTLQFLLSHRSKTHSQCVTPLQKQASFFRPGRICQSSHEHKILSPTHYFNYFIIYLENIFYPKSYMWDSLVPDISEYLSNFQLGVHI